MKTIYKGLKLDSFVPAQRKKLEAKLDKLAKVVDGREEREIHIVVTTERHIHQTEITVNIRDHVLVCTGSSPDLLASVSSAIDKLEKQVRKLRAKFRDTRRGPENSLKIKTVEVEVEQTAPKTEEAEPDQPQVFRVNHRANQKPLTLEEAMLAFEDGRNYIIYRDAETDRLSVLLRRRDGHFDLVEA